MRAREGERGETFLVVYFVFNILADVVLDVVLAALQWNSPWMDPMRPSSPKKWCHVGHFPLWDLVTWGT